MAPTLSAAPSDATREQLGIQGLGWVVRRTARAVPALARFYEQGLGLPSLRPASPAGAIMLWAGDLVMFELSELKPGRGTAARTEELSAGFSVRDPDALLAPLQRAGAQLLGAAPAGGRGRAATLIDPDGRLLALLPRDARSIRSRSGVPADRPRGARDLPPGFDGLTRIAVRVAEPRALAGFYGEALGLTALGAASDESVRLALGRGIELELRPGGHRHDPPADRGEVPDVWILRVYEHDRLAKHLRSVGARIVNEVRITGGVLTYAVDPEGHLFGIQQRTPDLLPAGAAERVEDVAAREAWVRQR